MTQFSIEQIVAGGTFGTVCVVSDGAGKQFAAKALKTDHLDNPRVVSRLRDEAMLLSRLNHPNIVQVNDLLDFRDRPVIVMEWIRGCNLEELIIRNRHGLPIPETLAMIAATASALDAAWSDASGHDGTPLRVIHRDIKPSNILLTVDGVLKVVDFGTAQGRFEGRESETISMVLGARAYLAPERLDGAEDKPEGDVYALGHVLYELMEGAPIQLSLHPFHHRKMLQGHLDEIRLDDIGEHGPTVRDLIGRMCAYTPDERPSHAEVASTLRDVISAAGLEPDLTRFAREFVQPIFEQRANISPRRHPAWPEVSFLESGLGQRPPPPQPIDDKIRAFLLRDDWFDEIDTLRSLLAADSNWSAEPFIEFLEGAVSPWWRFWTRDKLPPEQIAALLETLRDRPSRSMATRLKSLLRHSDPQVKYLAAELISQPARG
jgi:serine/threonine-protein kinase